MRWLDGAVPPPRTELEYELPREHVGDVGNIAITQSMDKQTQCTTHMFAGYLVLMELRIANAEKGIKDDAAHASSYMSSILREERQAGHYAQQLGLKIADLEKADSIAANILRDLKQLSDDGHDLWGHIADVDASLRASQSQSGVGNVSLSLVEVAA